MPDRTRALLVEEQPGHGRDRGRLLEGGHDVDGGTASGSDAPELVAPFPLRFVPADLLRTSRQL